MSRLPPSNPKSLFDGVEAAARLALEVANTRHRSALRPLKALAGREVVSRVFQVIESNYQRSGASANKDRSRENWRWCSIQARIAPTNYSPEVVLERAIAASCLRAGRNDWANQIPVASGLINSASDRRRAIDLVQQRNKGHFEFIELKIESDTPLYAAVEIIGYTCIWLLARADRPNRPLALLDADRIDLRVLAPTNYYAPFPLIEIESSLACELLALGAEHGVTLTFAFDVLPNQLATLPPPDDEALLTLLATRHTLQAGAGHAP